MNPERAPDGADGITSRREIEREALGDLGIAAACRYQLERLVLTRRQQRAVADSRLTVDRCL